jgi:hypothetical protein
MTYDAPTTEERRGPVFVAAVLHALGRTPIWLFTALVMLVLGAIAALPWVDWFGQALGHRYAPGEVLAGMSEVFRFDHRGDLGELRARTGQTVALLGLVAMIFGVFAAGGWLQVFLEHTSGHSVRRFLWGGSRYFWRFVRVWILTLIVLAFLSWLCLGWPWKTLIAGLLFGAPGGETEVFTSEWSALALGWLQAGAHALLFALTLVWADYARTRLALLDTKSALVAGVATIGLLVRYPVRALRPMLLLFGIEVLVLWLAGRATGALDAGLATGASWHDVALLFLVGQVALLWRAIHRGARYHAAVSVSRDLVPPLARPDPWASRVGGPGGPQYPIDTTDEYGVSL